MITIQRQVLLQWSNISNSHTVAFEKKIELILTINLMKKLWTKLKLHEVEERVFDTIQSCVIMEKCIKKKDAAKTNVIPKQS